MYALGQFVRTDDNLIGEIIGRNNGILTLRNTDNLIRHVYERQVIAVLDSIEPTHAMYILVNNSLNFHAGILAKQVSRAVESYLNSDLATDSSEGALFEAYRHEGDNKRLLWCSPEQLEELCIGFPSSKPVRDLYIATNPSNSITCINLGIIAKSDVPEVVRQLQPVLEAKPIGL